MLLHFTNTHTKVARTVIVLFWRMENGWLNLFTSDRDVLRSELFEIGIKNAYDKKGDETCLQIGSSTLSYYEIEPV